MATQLSYADALKVLGAKDSPVLDFAEKLAEGGLEALGVPSFGGLRTLVVKHGRAQLEALRQRVTGASRLERSQRLAAAHAVIVVTAYFEALDAELAGTGITLADFALSGAEQGALASGSAPPADRSELLIRLASSGIPMPDPARPPDRNRGAVADFYIAVLGPAVAAFLSGLDAWQRLSGFQRSELRAALARVPESATARYAESYRRLTADFAEFGAWNWLLEHEATRRRIDTGIAGLERLLGEMTTGAAPEARRAALAARYRAALARPVLASTEVPEDFALPSLERAYVNFSALMAGCGGPVRGR